MSYPGSKASAGVYQLIIGQMRPHTVYVEPFYGSGQIFNRKRPALVNYLIDLNPSILQAKTDGRRGAHFVCGDAFEWLNRFSRHPQFKLNRQAVVYCDPPYMLSTRKQGRRYYAEELTDDDHSALLTALRALKCDVLISHPLCDLYLEKLQGWRCIEYTQMTRRGKMRDALWCNFPEPDALHDWRFAGRTFRERWAMTKQLRRELAKLDAMPPRRRGFVLAGIEERYSGSPSAFRGAVRSVNASDGATAENRISQRLS